MPRLVKVTYGCGCSAFGNPDFRCPKHDKYVATHSHDEMVHIDRCLFCRRVFKPEEAFSWKKEKSKEAVAAHTRCLVESGGWKSGSDGKYSHVAYRESNENSSNFRESEQRERYLCSHFG